MPQPAVLEWLHVRVQAKSKILQLTELAAAEAAKRQQLETELAERLQQAEVQWESRCNVLGMEAEQAKTGSFRACEAVKGAVAALGSIESKAQLLALSMEGKPPDALTSIATEAKTAKSAAVSVLETARLSRAAPRTPSSAITASAARL